MQHRSRIKVLVALACALSALAVAPALARLPLPSEIKPGSTDYHGCGVWRFADHPWKGRDSSGVTETGDHWNIAYKGAHGDCTFVKAQLKLLLRHSAEYFEQAGKGTNHASFNGGTCKWSGSKPKIDPLNKIDCIVVYHHAGHIYRPGHGAPTIQAFLNASPELIHVEPAPGGDGGPSA